MATSLPSIKIVLVNTIEPIDIQVLDGGGVPIDASELKLEILTIGGSVIFTDDFFVAGTNIVKVAGQTGYYYYKFGILPQQTNSTGQFLFKWTVQTPSSLPDTVVQNVEVISARSYSLIPYFRLIIDKSRKLVDPANDVFLGYTDAQLIMFLEGGLQIINGYQPETVSGFTLDNFPWDTFRHIGLEAALMAGVLSQQMFAIDTDMPNYSDQGTQFVIAHQPQLASYLNSVTARLDKAIPLMKLQFVTTGSIHLQMGGGFGLNMLVAASPTGSLFRNMFFKS